MAGIAGIILKKKNENAEDYFSAFKSMMDCLSFSESQERNFYAELPFLFGNVIPISKKTNDRFQHNQSLNLYCIIDGLVFIDEQEKAILVKKYEINETKSDYELVPYLFDHYDEKIIFHIHRDGTIFFFLRPANNDGFIFNDRFGYLPLYFYESDLVFIFSSKIESLLASGLIPNIEFDTTTIAEHLFFNYPLSDNTYIKNIQTLSNASFTHLTGKSSSFQKYWNMGELFNNTPVDEKESMQLIYSGMRKALKKILPQSPQTLNFSLTGGWDSRVILAFILTEFREKLHLFSFGAKDSADITIPQQISEKEHLNYTPFILDQYYLDNSFIQNAKKTIELSNGTRSYKRAHYLYSAQKIAEKSDILISGIFGDQVFKFVKPGGGAVLSQNAINLISSDFSVDQTMEHFITSPFLNYLRFDTKKLNDELAERLKILKQNMNIFDTISQKYYSFRFELNLRKYFGHEVNSYNDFIYSFSPFIDYDFLKDFSQTKYFGSRFPFNSNSIKLKKQSTLLYYNIVNSNFPSLTYYNSTRGFSMHDAITLSGNLKIVL